MIMSIIKNEMKWTTCQVSLAFGAREEIANFPDCLLGNESYMGI